MNYNSVSYDYTLPIGEVKKVRGAACFSDIYSGNHPISIKYYCTVQNLTKDECNYFAGFLKNILDNNIFKYKLTKSGTIALWKLDTKNLNRKQALLYLTLQRYLYEGFPLVKELFKYKDKPLKKQWEMFYHVHKMCYKGDFKFGGDNLAGHGAIYFYCNGDDGYYPLDLKVFKERLKDKDIKDVHSYFAGGTKKSVKTPKEKLKKLEEFWELA